MARKSEPITTGELVGAINAIREAASAGAQLADRPFKHLASGEIELDRENLYDLLNAQRDLQDLFHKVFTLHTQKQDRRELEDQLRAQVNADKK